MFLMAGALSAQNLTSVWGTNGCDTVPSTKHLGRVFVGLKTNNFAPASTNIFFGWNGTTYGWFVPAGGGGGGTPGGVDSNIQFNNGGVLGGTNSLSVIALNATDIVVTNKSGGKFALMAPGIAIGSTNAPAAGFDVEFRMGANAASRWDDAGKGLIDTIGNTLGKITQKWYRREDNFGVEHVYNGDTDSKYYIANRQGDVLIGSKSGNIVQIGHGYSGGFTPIVSVDANGLNGHGNSISNFTGMATSEDIVILEDVEAQGTDVADSGSATWGVRRINTVSYDNGGHVVTQATNSFELATGTYDTHVHINGYNVGHTKMRFQNVTDNTTVQEGETIITASGSGYVMDMDFVWTNNVAGKKFSIQQYVQTSEAGGRGFGCATSVGQERYLNVKFRKR